MIEYISQPWPWYVSGPMIALVMFLLLKAGGEFGVSSTLRTICSIGGAGKKIPFFNFNWRDQIWNLVFVFGAAIGGFIAASFLNNGAQLNIAQNTIKDLNNLGISFSGQYAPDDLFSWAALMSIKGFMAIVIGGFFVGFGARYAGGCTSGHAISGLSNFQLPSLIAVVGFFIGGLFTTYFLYPIIF